MNIRVQTNYLLPVWLVIWLTALTVFIDLTFLRAQPVQTTIKSAEVKKAYRGGGKCELGLSLPQGYFRKSTDTKTCKLVSKGDVVTLERSRILKRWIALHDSKNNQISGILLENRILTDLIFILLAVLVPLLVHSRFSLQFKQTTLIAFGLQIFGVIYFWVLFLS